MPVASGLTPCGIFAPDSPASRLSAQIRAMASRVPTVALAMCGATIRFGVRKSGLSGAGGSGSVTSRPAAKITPLFRASIRSFSTTIGPRAVFTNTAVGFIMRKRSALNKPCVVSFRSVWTETKSDSRSSTSSSA